MKPEREPSSGDRRRHWWTPAPAAALMLLLAACGGSGGASSSPPPTPTVSSPASSETTTPSSSASARLRISQRQTSCCYIEGQVSYLVVRDEDGRTIAKRAFQISDPDEPVIDLRIAPGRYVVTSYQRPCDGNCGYLDPPTDRCTKRITVAPDDDVVLTVEFAPGQGCQLV